MKPIEELLKNLARAEVLEFGLVTNRLPSVNVGGKFEPVDDEAPSTERLLDILSKVGGRRLVEGLGDKPVQWTTRVDGIGVVAIAAIMRKDVVQARFTVARRDRPARTSTSPTPIAPTVSRKEPPALPSQVASRAPHDARPKPPSASMRAQPPAAPSSQAQPGAQGFSPSVVQSASSAKSQPPTSAVMKAAPQGPAAAPIEPVPPPDDFDDDDEPTVQTLSPPLSRPPQALAKAKAKPASPKSEEAARDPDPLAAPPPRTEREVSELVPVEEVIKKEEPPAKLASGAPPSAIASDVEITKNLGDAKGLTLDLEEEDGNTVEIQPAGGELPAAAPARVEAALSTSPSVATAEEDRPGGDATLEGYLAMATSARATDLHLVAGRPVLVRVASDLVPRTQIVAPEHVERVVREMVPPRLRSTLEGDGACDFAFEHPKHGRFRVNVSRQRTGLKVSMRVVAREVPTLASLGLPDSLRAAALHPSGLVLVTGPAGHGKTTTVAALVNVLCSESVLHVITVEDPIEIVHAPKRAIVSQREVGTHVDSMASAMAAALREDPDVLVAGELREAETIRRALDACEAGCLVLATAAATSAAKAVERILDSFDEAERSAARARLAGALRAIIGQRLVQSADRTRLHAAAELLPSSLLLYRAIRDDDVDGIATIALQKAGRTRLDDSLAELVRAQHVTIEVAKQFAEAPAELEQALRRPSSADPAVARRA